MKTAQLVLVTLNLVLALFAYSRFEVLRERVGILQESRVLGRAYASRVLEICKVNEELRLGYQHALAGVLEGLNVRKDAQLLALVRSLSDETHPLPVGGEE